MENIYGAMERNYGTMEKTMAPLRQVWNFDLRRNKHGRLPKTINL